MIVLREKLLYDFDTFDENRPIDILIYTRILGPYGPFEILAPAEGLITVRVKLLALLAKYS